MRQRRDAYQGQTEQQRHLFALGVGVEQGKPANLQIEGGATPISRGTPGGVLLSRITGADLAHPGLPSPCRAACSHRAHLGNLKVAYPSNPVTSASIGRAGK